MRLINISTGLMSAVGGLRPPPLDEAAARIAAVRVSVAPKPATFTLLKASPYRARASRAQHPLLCKEGIGGTLQIREGGFQVRYQIFDVFDSH